MPQWIGSAIAISIGRGPERRLTDAMTQVRYDKWS
jgi:hypothetical protein